MSPSAKYAIIGSIEPYTGKSAAILGIADCLLKQEIDVAYGKPLGTCFDEDGKAEQDVRFIAELLELKDDRIGRPLLGLTAEAIGDRLQGKDTTDYLSALKAAMPEARAVLVEAPGTLDEGKLFGLSLPEMAEALDSAVILVCRFHTALLVEALLAARDRLGDRPIGVIFNDIPTHGFDEVATIIRPFLERQGIDVFALLPQNAVLRGVGVAELVRQLDAEVLCCDDRLDLMVETLQIGAMSVNAAVQYFSSARNMAVVTGGDRYDIQLAALEASTHCLILTGRLKPLPMVLDRAREMEIPVLSVDRNTLETVEIIDSCFGQVRLQEPIKVECIKQMMAEHLDVERLTARLGIEGT